MRRLLLVVGASLFLLLLVVLLWRPAGGGAPGLAPEGSASPHEASAAASVRAGDAPETGPASQAETATQARSPAGAPATEAARLDLSFKLDPRVTKGLHMGERWVSPQTYTSTGPQERVSVHARAQLVREHSRLPAAPTAWSASAPDMVEVSPPHGEQVQITVRRVGESHVTVSSGGTSRTLLVKASRLSGGLRLDITQ